MPQPTQGSIAAGHPKTAEAGLEIFRLGGNAFDAAVAAVCASFVTEPMLTSPAGGGFLLAHTQDNQDILFDFFTQTPRQKRPASEVDFYPVTVDFGGVTQDFHIGLGSIATPGTIAGLYQVQQKLGRLPFSVVLEPAIHYAKTGIEITEFQAYSYKILSPILLASAEAKRILAPQGIPQQGDRFTFPDLAATLSEFAKTGIDSFYHGELARQIVKDAETLGGYLTLADLEQYRVIERQPFKTHYRDNTFLTNPPPSSGGTLIAFALRLLEQIDLSTISFGSIEHQRILADVMRLTNLARKDGYADRLYEPDIADRFLADEHLAQYIQQLTSEVNKWGSTTHVSAIDSEGNAASVTSSNGEGSSYVIPGTGIMMNNMLGEADLHPGGFHQWQENVRISSMMAPTMILHNGKPEIVLGSGGSNRIRTAILQVISNLLDFQMPVESAVCSPRMHWESGTFNLEPGFEAGTDRTFPFDGIVERWQAQNMFFGGVHAVTRSLNGELAGAGDRRRGGAVEIYGRD
ncbi:MAG TPA: gamma-glutamyltransferase [Trichocoleus sp.]|jgi:gamma-glutamyltranspeptidase/glutathione hydrolase